MQLIQLNNKTLGELVSENPCVVPVLNKHSLDYCCGGKDLLSRAIQNAGLDEDEIVREVEDAILEAGRSTEEFKDWRKATIAEIVDRILQTHHIFMKQTLAELNTLMFKVLKVHYQNHGDELLPVHHLFGTLKTELEAHLVKEEESLFPRIREYAATGETELREEILSEMVATEDEHDAAGDLFKELNKVTRGYQTPSDGCFSFRRAYELLDALEKDTFNHIHMENSILFEAIRSSLQCE